MLHSHRRSNEKPDRTQKSHAAKSRHNFQLLLFLYPTYVLPSLTVDKKNIADKYSNFVKLLDELENKISKLSNKVIDKSVRKDMSVLIKKCDNYVDGFEHLLSYYNKTNQASKYENTKIDVDKLKTTSNLMTKTMLLLITKSFKKLQN